MPGPTLVWLRDDLRLADNPALSEAAARGPVVALYVLDEDSPGMRPLGGASRWWLHHALTDLAASLARHGVPFVVTRGRAEPIVTDLAGRIGASRVTWSRRYTAPAIAVDTSVKAALTAAGIAADSFNASLLAEPWTVANKAGDPFRVFSPFWRAVTALGEPPAPLPVPVLRGAGVDPVSLGGVPIADLGLLPAIDWAGGLREAWTPGEAGAQARLSAFIAEGLAGYATGRDHPDRDATSRLSPHLRWGGLSPRQAWHAVRQARLTGRSPASASDETKFLAELGWREFSYHLLYNNQDLATANFQPRFDAFPWERNDAALTAWQEGRTGYPIVDAGMRQLWETGWMHNRVRMIAASFLIKDVLIDWRRGEDWFWDTLADADPASNAASWQWVAGSGADAAPYFRVFNPVLQGERFDPEGDYVRRFVPELTKLPAGLIHKPWTASHDVLRRAGVSLGSTYPHRIVDHEVARDRALSIFASLKPNSDSGRTAERNLS